MAPLRVRKNRRIEVHAGTRAIATPTRSALVKLGYQLVPANRDTGHDSSLAPNLRIVDDCKLDEVPSVEVEPRTPIVLLTGVQPLTRAGRDSDSRILGRVTRPAALTPLYRLLQAGLQKFPRRVPRVATRLPARSVRSQLSIGAILSLSEQGCLLRTSENKIDTGMRLQVQFALPTAGLLSLTAKCVHEDGTDLGLSFHEPPATERQAIAGFVSDLLVSR